MQKYRSIHIIELFQLFSLAVSFVLWTFLNFYVDDFLINSFFPSMLLVGTYLSFIKSYSVSSLVKNSNHYPLLFLGQYLCLTFTSFQFELVGLFYLGTIPCMAALMYLIWMSHLNDSKKENRDSILLAVTASSYLVIYLMGANKFPSGAEIFLAFIFCAQIFGLIYFGGESYRKTNRSVFLSLLKRSKVNKFWGEGQKPMNDRLFFHDIINQTHGVNLYLSRKLMLGESISVEDIESLKSEIKMVQTLITDHFDLKHKNVIAPMNFVAFISVKEKILRTAESFLPDNLVNKYFVFNGYLEENTNLSIQHNCLIHYPTFMRIFVNLVKNVSEQECKEVSFVFNYDSSGLTLVLKNKMTNLEGGSSDLAQNLSRIILKNDNPAPTDDEDRLGLESISALCRRFSGKYEFRIEGEYWISKVNLPAPIPASMENIERILLDKKIAS